MLAITDLKCDSVTHSLLIISSSIMLFIYLSFLLCEQTLFSSNSFDIIVPWGSFERTMSGVRILIKLVISIGFMFDKRGDYRGEVNLVLFILQTF
jgi:hypothetical protein